MLTRDLQEPGESSLDREVNGTFKGESVAAAQTFEWFPIPVLLVGWLQITVLPFHPWKIRAWQAHALPNAVNSRKQRAIDLARIGQHQDVVEFLLGRHLDNIAAAGRE